MKITDKWGKSIDISKASVGKLKAMLIWMEGLVYKEYKRYHDCDVEQHDRVEAIKNMKGLLPDEYSFIVEELVKRERYQPYTSFKFMDTIGF